jgi:flagellum-specific ATP synthase
MATYTDMEELIRLGAYRRGSSESVDEAIDRNADLEAFLAQEKDETSSIQDGYEQLARIVIGSGEEDPMERGSTE